MKNVIRAEISAVLAWCMDSFICYSRINIKTYISIYEIGETQVHKPRLSECEHMSNPCFQAL